MSQGYRKLAIKQLPKTSKSQTPEARYWKKFRFPILLQQFGSVTRVEFSPVAPHDFAVTSSARVIIYNSKTNEPKQTITKFKETAFGASFRQDGQLIVAGGEEGIIRLFDVAKKHQLRTFTGHTDAVHVTRFSTNRDHVMSGGDDGTVRCWDVSTGEAVAVLGKHEDRVRAGVTSPASPDVWASAGYDNKIRVWDVRAKECIKVLDHGHQVEDLLFYPSGGVLVSAGDNVVKIWDVLGGFNVLDTLTAHQKTVMSLALDSTRTRLFTAGADQLVKIYDTTSYKVTHTIKYQAPIMSIAVSPNNTHLITGMSDGTLSIRHRVVDVNEEAAQAKEDPQYNVTNWRYYIRGRTETPGEDDLTIEKKRAQRLQPYDRYLRKFNYREALNAALQSKQVVVIVSLFEEFIRRKSVNTAISGLNEVTIQPLLNFLTRYIIDPKYSKTLVVISNFVLDIYSKVLGQSKMVDDMMLKLQQRVQAEVNLEKNLHGLLGVMDLIMASNSTSLRRVATHDINEYKTDNTTDKSASNTEVNNTMNDVVEDDTEDKMNLS
jgi:U3 small nucleolar RNA-associated protein 15